MNLNKVNSSVFFYVLLGLTLTACFFDLVFYQSYFFIFIALASVTFLLISFFFFSIVENVAFSISFIVLAFTYYAFTIAPYTSEAEKGAFFATGPLIFISLVIMVASRKENSKIIFTFFDKVLITIIFLSLSISDLVVNSAEITDEQGILKFLTVGGSLILFANYFPSYLHERNKILTSFLKVIVYMGIVSGIFGILTIIYPNLIANNEYPGLSTSFYKHPNATSSIYNYTIPITIWFLVFKGKELVFMEKWVFITGIMISLVSLFFTFSRFGIAMVLLSALILFYRYSKKIFVVTIGLLVVSSSFFVANFFTSKGSLTLIGRVGLLQTALELFKDNTHFLFGYGGISTKLIFENVKFSLGVADLNNSPHNIILYSIILYGLIFTIALFLFFLKYYLISLFYFFKHKVSDLFVLSLSVCSGLFFKNMGEDLLFFQEFFMWYLFLIFFGLLMIELRICKNRVA